MKLKLHKVKERITKIPTENLYIALIGRIESKIVSDDLYINRGEQPYYYTIVKKEDKYKDVFNNSEYNFRDEEESYTILKMLKYPVKDFFVTLDILKEKLTDYNDILEEEINNYNKNKYFVRARVNNCRKSV